MSEEFYAELEEMIAGLINKYSLENKSDTPDFILAKFLVNTLRSFNEIMDERKRWYGRNLYEEIVEVEEGVETDDPEEAPSVLRDPFYRG